MTKVWAWLKKWGAWLLSALLVVLTLGWFVRRHVTEIGQVRDKLAVAEATKEIEKLRAVRQEVAARVGEKDEAIAAIDRQLAQQRRRVVEAHEFGEGLSDEEIADAFEKLGI